jgi:hypothetical protein
MAKELKVMADNLSDLLQKDRDARDFYDSLPLFIRDQTRTHSEEIQTIADLSAFANMSMHDALLLGQYQTMFEDETDSEADMI